MTRIMFLVLLWGAFASTVLAYEAVVTEVSEPYAIVPVAISEHDTWLQLGVLEGFPVMYEMRSDEPFAVSLQLGTVSGQAPDNATFTLMVVRLNDDGGGVTEVARIYAGADTWTPRKDVAYGLTFMEGEQFTHQYEPGVYRIEVSTPDNVGKYLLAFGSVDESAASYFQMLKNVRTVQKHFGASGLHILRSSYVYYPLGILFLLFIINRTWKYRKTIAHAA